MLRMVISSAAALVLALPAAGCGEDGDSDGGVTVVASTPLVADLVRAVAGEEARVVSLLPRGADPHDYEPRPSDARALAEADALIRSGGDIDGWIADLREGAGSDAPALDLLGSVDARGEGERDPHWWHDPRNAAQAVGAIRDQLADIDPAGDAAYDRNATAYVERIERLDRAVEACIEQVPRERRELVTSHDGLGHLARRYGLEVVGSTIPALTTQAQPSAGEIDELVELIRERDVEAVFPESGVPRQLERAVAGETDAMVGEELFVDGLGPEGSPGDTYLGAAAENARRIAAGLTGGEVECEAAP